MSIKQCNMVFIAGFTFLLISVPGFSGTFKARQGDFWLGGSFQFASEGYSFNGSNSTHRYNMLKIAPILRYFPVAHLFAGPKFTWTGYYYHEDDRVIVDLGGEIGCVFGGRVLPYLLTAPHVCTMETDTRFYLPFALGIIAPLVKNMGLQFEIGYSLGFLGKGTIASDERFTYNTFSVGFGFCGTGERLAISVMNSISSLTTSF